MIKQEDKFIDGQQVFSITKGYLTVSIKQQNIFVSDTGANYMYDDAAPLFPSHKEALQYVRDLVPKYTVGDILSIYKEKVGESHGALYPMIINKLLDGYCVIPLADTLPRVSTEVTLNELHISIYKALDCTVFAVIFGEICDESTMSLSELLDGVLSVSELVPILDGNDTKGVWEAIDELMYAKVKDNLRDNSKWLTMNKDIMAELSLDKERIIE